MKNIVTIGGGSGTRTVLTALKKHAPETVHLQAIVSMADDGGSTGILREQYGVLPPGDIRQALTALAHEETLMTHLFNYRFETGVLRGHNCGNIVLAAMEKISGTFAMALTEASRILAIDGEVIPVTLDNIRLGAEFEDGTIVHGETNIDIPKVPFPQKIKKLWLSPEAHINPRAQEAIRNADMIVIGPGDLYTSILPNFLVGGVVKSLAKSKATKIYVCNLMTKFGETQGLRGENFAKKIQEYLGPKSIDFMIFNDRRPSKILLEKYREEKAEFVEPPYISPDPKRKPVHILADLLSTDETVIRHDEDKLGRLILSLI
jgi:uncharacterized cofD-like protein